MALFDPNLVYPCDSTGPYTELGGTIVSVGEPLHDDDLDNSVAVKVETSEGAFTGYLTYSRMLPEVGYRAIIRLYRSGGGWYPDDRIVGWSSEDGSRSYRSV